MNNSNNIGRRVSTGGSPLVVDLGGNKIISSVPATNFTAKEIVIDYITDSSLDKTVTAFTKGGPRKILLWSGASYDAIGQWTDQDVINRVKEIYK